MINVVSYRKMTFSLSNEIYISSISFRTEGYKDLFLQVVVLHVFGSNISIFIYIYYQYSDLVVIGYCC